MRLALCIEGQEGVTWDDWRALAAACEEHGLEALFRSDHYGSAVTQGPGESLDAWATLAALAPLTARIRLGTMVSPVTYRHPSVLAKNVVTVDHVSHGRVEVGLGAGWMEYEHRAFGFPFPDRRTRLEVLAEQVEIVHRHLSGEPFSFSGKHYRLEECAPRPAPVQRPRPPIIVGGRGGRTSVRVAARFADEYNTNFSTVEECAAIRRRLDEAERPLRLSLMTGCVVGADRAEYEERLRRWLAVSGEDEGRRELPQWARDVFVAGTVDEAAERLRAYERAGVERVMLNHLAFRDVEMVALIGRELVPVSA
jgi:F420-dependent oxidoreductase-like protein